LSLSKHRFRRLERHSATERRVLTKRILLHLAALIPLVEGLSHRFLDYGCA